MWSKVNDNLENNQINSSVIKPVVNKQIIDNFEFTINRNDIIFVITPNNSINNKGVRNLVCKMVVINGSHSIYLDELGKALPNIKMDKFNIFSINNDILDINIVKNSLNLDAQFIEMNVENFIKTFNNNFLNYNKDSLYIFRGGDFLSVKNLFSTIENCHTNIGRGGSQKSHVLSPLDFRLSTYLLVMFNFNYKLINSLNIFNSLDKRKYLSYMDKTYEFVSILSRGYNPILINKMPNYSNNPLLSNYNLNCNLSCKTNIKDFLK